VKPAISADDVSDSPGTADAAPVVLLPGMIAGDWMWGATPDVLSHAGYRVVTFRDAIGLVTNSIDTMTDFLEAHLERLSIERLTLVGASLGSAVALTYAARHPDRVMSLVLSGAPTMVGNAQLGISSFGKLTRGIADAAADRLFYDRSRLEEGIVERTYRTFLDKRLFVNVVRLMRASETFDSMTPLRAIDIDTLMVWGEEDRISRCDDWRRILPHVKRGTFVTIPLCGHSPMLERPEEFNRALTEFLQARVR
jgi:2-hydroxy-6-oxonona-2,4-dienedioate hydrolase